MGEWGKAYAGTEASLKKQTIKKDDFAGEEKKEKCKQQLNGWSPYFWKASTCIQ